MSRQINVHLAARTWCTRSWCAHYVSEPGKNAQYVGLFKETYWYIEAPHEVVYKWLEARSEIMDSSSRGNRS